MAASETFSSGLRRTLGWPSLAAYGLGAILGAGIYSVIGAAAGRVGEGMWLAFLLSAAVAVVTALSYAELATMLPRAGGEFVYVRRALPRPRAASFVTGGMMAATSAATAATVAIAFGGYLSALADVSPALVAPLLLVALAGVAVAGIRESAGMVALFTCIEAAGLVIVIVVGAGSDRFADALAASPPPEVFAGAALVFFSFLGFENIVNLAEETRRPERDLPRAILASIAVATVLYVLVALAAIALLPPDELAASDAPLADAVRARHPSLAGALGGIALFATANTAMASLVSGSRVVYAMAKARELPRPLASVLPGRRTPWLATLAILAIALALLPLGDVAVVASVSSFAALVAFAAIHVALIVLRFRAPRERRPFRVPLSIGPLPLLPVIGALASLLLLGQLDPRAIAYGLALAAALLVVHVVKR